MLTVHYHLDPYPPLPWVLASTMKPSLIMAVALAAGKEKLISLDMEVAHIKLGTAYRQQEEEINNEI